MLNKLSFAGILLLYCLRLAAQSLPDTLTGGLDDVVVSVNKWEQKQNEIPNAIARVNMREARLHNPQTSADLLSLTGQVFIQKSQLGGGSPMIRGFATNRVLLVVDGVRMNNAIFRSGNLQNVISIDALAVQNAEVVFGPGSIIYGSDAIGGVMDFHTLQPVFSKSKKMLVKLNSLARYSSANNEATGHVDFNIASQKLSLLGSLTHSRFSDLRMGKRGGQDNYLRKTFVQRFNNVDSILVNPDPHVQKQSGYRQWNALAKLRFRPTSAIDLLYAFHFSATGDVPRYDRLIENNNLLPSFAEWYYGPQKWTMHQLQSEVSKPTFLYNSIRASLSLQRYEESRNDRRFNNSRLRNQSEAVDIWTLNLDASKQFFEKHELFYGAEYVANKVSSHASRRNIVTGAVEPTATRYPDGSTWNSAGVYASYKFNISRKITLSSGLRYSRVHLQSTFDTTFFNFPFTSVSLSKGALTGSAGIVYRPAERWLFSTNFSTGFRVPNIDDIGKVFDSEPGNVMVPNPALAAEYAYNVDVSTGYSHAQKLKFDLTVFYTLLDNAIVRRPFSFNGSDSIRYESVQSRVQALQNVANATVWGVQAGADFMVAKNLRTVIRANYIDGRETDDDKNEQVRLRHAPPFFGSAAVKYERAIFSLELNSQFNGGISASDLAPSEQSKPFIYATDNEGRPYSPGWHTLNFKATYQALPQVQVAAGIENITDRRYRPYSSGIVAPGRNFIISVRAGL